MAWEDRLAVLSPGNLLTDMSKISVFCIATSRSQAGQIVDRLKDAEFSKNDLSVLFLDKGTTRDFAHAKNTKTPEGAVAGAGTGGVIGGALGWIAGIGALAIPGVGPFITAGPIIAALSGAAVGAAVGGIAGGLIGLGIPEIEAKRYEGKVKAGNILISVTCLSTHVCCRRLLLDLSSRGRRPLRSRGYLLHSHDDGKIGSDTIRKDQDHAMMPTG